MKGIGEKTRGSSTSDAATAAAYGIGESTPSRAGTPGAAAETDKMSDPAVVDDGGRRSPGGPVEGGGGDEAGVDRILTVPNAITLVRLACIPLFLWLLFGAGRQTAAAFLLGGLGATDWVDGFVARRYNQVSTVGKVLDPLADRVLVVTAVIAITVHGAVPVWFGVATLAREVVVSAAVLLLASLGAARIDVLWVGKAGTFALMFSYPAFLLSYGTAGWQGPIHVFAWVTGLIGLTLAWIAAASYVPVARKALADGRRARAATARGASS